jgi:hypothetical protein
VRSIGREDCRRIRDLVSALPAHATKRWPGKSMTAAAELARNKGLTPMDPATANAYLGRLSTLMRWAEREEYIAKDPAVGLTDLRHRNLRTTGFSGAYSARKRP